MKLPPLPNGASLKIAKAEGILGGTIWPSAGELCQHLLDRYYHCNDGTIDDGTTTSFPSMPAHRSWNILELGSGTGAVGLFAASLGIFRSVHLSEHRPPLAAAIPSVPYNVDGSIDWELLQSDVTSTDMAKSDRLLRLLQQNVDQNDNIVCDGGQGTSPYPSSWPPSIHELDWSIEDHVPRLLEDSACPDGFELLLASDVTYVSELHDSLATTIARLLRNATTTTLATNSLETPPASETTVPTKCLVAHQQRVLNLKGEDHQLASFKSAVKKAGLQIATVHHSPENRALSILEVCHAHHHVEGDESEELWIP